MDMFRDFERRLLEMNYWERGHFWRRFSGWLGYCPPREIKGFCCRDFTGTAAAIFDHFSIEFQDFTANLALQNKTNFKNTLNREEERRRSYLEGLIARNPGQIPELQLERRDFRQRRLSTP